MISMVDLPYSYHDSMKYNVGLDDGIDRSDLIRLGNFWRSEVKIVILN